MNKTLRKLLAMLMCLVLLSGFFPAALAEDGGENTGTIVKLPEEDSETTDEKNAMIAPVSADPEADDDILASGTCGENLSWNLIEGGTLQVSGSGPMTDYEWDYDQNITSAPWIDYALQISSLVLQNGVTSIGNEAFDGCTNLTEVQLPNTLTRIGEYGLQACSFSEITLPDAVTELGEGAFLQCTALESIVLPEGIERISVNLFYGCTALTSVTIPAGVSEIGVDAFSTCDALREIRFGGTTEQWRAVAIESGNSCFREVQVICSDGTIDYSDSCGPNATWSFDESNGTLTISGSGSIWDDAYPWSDFRGEILRVIVEEGITALGSSSMTLGVFQDCVNLTQVSLPESLTLLGGRCFQDCDSLVEVQLPASLQEITQGAFGDCDSLLRLPVSEGNESFVFVDGVLYNKDMTTLIVCPGGKEGEFTVPDSVTVFGPRPFWGCRKLTVVHIPDTVTDLGNNTFQRCVSLKEVNIPAGVTQLPISCFYTCSSLEEITIPANVTSLYGIPFYECSSLKRVTFLGSAPTIQLGGTIFDDSVTAVAYYPGDDSSWTTDYRNDLGGNITWIALLTTSSFPDEAFCAWVKENVDTDGDGLLTDVELEAVTRLEVGGLGISSLEGIRYFPKLQVLDCSDNALTALDLGGNSALTSVYCNDNQISQLDISSCPELETLACYHNELKFLELGFSPKLSEASQSEARTGSLGQDVLLYGGSGDAFVLAVDRGLSLQTPEGSLPVVAGYFPDQAFRSYVEENLDQDGDAILSHEELEAVTRIVCNGEGWLSRGDIRSLQGIEHFAKLQYLSCSYNHIPTIDLSANPELTELYCEFIDLTELDLSANSKLQRMSCYGNELTKLDLSANPALTYCQCGHNSIAELDLSANLELRVLYCFGMKSLEKLDVRANAELRFLGTEATSVGSVDLSGNPNLTMLHVYNCDLQELDLSHNPKLLELDCSSNELSSLDLSSNPLLEELYCCDNKLTTLNLSANLELEFLDCHGNSLGGLDLSANSKLETLRCYDNQIEILDLSVCPTLAEAAGTEPVSLEDYGSGVVGYGAYQDYEVTCYHLLVDGSTQLVTGVIPGDLNGNGTVESDDLLRLRSFLVGTDLAVSSKTADLNGDGSVDILDLVRLRKYLAGEDVPLG